MNSEYSNYRRSFKKSTGKIRSYLVTERFMLLLIKILSGTDSIQMRSLHNMDRFISSIDREFYFKDPALTSLIIVIESFVDMRIKVMGRPLSETSLVVKANELLSGENSSEIRDNLIIPTISTAQSDVSDSFDISFVNDTIETTLKTYKIIQEKDKLIEISNEIDGGSDDIKESISKYRETVNRIMEYFHETDNDTSINEITHTKDGNFKEVLRNVFDNIKNPKTVLKTGLKMFNDFLGVGGFMNGKYYMIYANTNTFKSALMEHIAIWVAAYNSDAFINDPDFKGKTPTILFVSCENSRQEDIERYFKMEIGDDIGNYETVDEIESKWDRLQSTRDTIIDISFKHEKARNVSVSDVDKMIDTLNDSGYKVIMVIYDYLELAKPEDSSYKLDTRESLGRISESFLNLAKTRDIPVITAMQMNREGGKVLVQTKESGDINAITKMNNAFIGESYNIEKATDFSFFIDLEINPHDGQKYLMFKKNKCRFSRLGAEMFAHKLEHGIVITDDLYLDETLSVSSLSYDKDGENATVSKSGKVGSRGTIDSRRPEANKTTILKSKSSSFENFANNEWWKFSALLDITDVMKCGSITEEGSCEKTICGRTYLFSDDDNGVTMI